MNAAADVLDTTRLMAAELVQHAERDTGSRMLAYQRVASAAGSSASWVRKFVAGDPAARVSLIAGAKIRAQYARLCETIEAKAAAEAARTREVLEKFDAATSGALDVVALVQETEAGGAPANGPGSGVTS